jgi:hypothetical protein
VKHERIVTDQPIRLLWTRFGVLESVSGARQLLLKQASEREQVLDEALVDAKAQGLAFSVRTAREYFSVPIENNLTNCCLAFYYGMLSLLQALLLGDPTNSLTLADVEGFTRRGHGLRVIQSEAGRFPESENLVVLQNGFLPRFLRAYRYPVKIADLAVERAYETVGDVPAGEQQKVIPIKALISRIPEVLSLYIELSSPDFLGIQVVGAESAARIHFPDAGNAPDLSHERIRDLLGWPSSIKFERDESSIRTVDHHDVASLLKIRAHHSSVLAYDSYVAPLHGIDDVLVIEFMLLYALSIWVRYRPALWREINEGSLDRFHALITNVLIAVERTGPNAVLDRLYGRSFLFAPFSYLA